MASESTSPRNLERLSHWRRVQYAFFGCVVVVGVLVVLDIVLSALVKGSFWGEWIFSEVFVIPVFVVCYLIAPYIVRRLPLE
jgi:hypothetical protein